ncbi:MAG: divalent-cation tolerance protein CutA [Cyanobacteria bacterium P01_A01_bin.84]
MSESTNYTLVLVTTSSVEEAETIAAELLIAKLAACVNILPLHCSIYNWQGQVNKDKEWQLLIKTNINKFSVLETKIKELHSYEVPEIIALPIIAGSQAYLSWMDEQVENN